MGQIKWCICRIRVMSIGEIVWRVKQKRLQKKERDSIFLLELPVTEIPLTHSLENFYPDVDRLAINWENRNFTKFETLTLFETFDYQIYKKKWNAGFQTENTWPEHTFTYKIRHGGREDIGDIRTNWELNRHFQFTALAKTYYVTGESDYLEELQDLFADWNRHNLFLQSVEWASAMEVAIRVSSWIYTYCFLKKSSEKYGKREEDSEICGQLSHGILVMTEYIIRHYARYSSANNHLVIEMYAVAMSGMLYNNEEWVQLAVSILTRELSLQNSEDGVNREMSMHYQSFVMEAYGLLMLQLYYNRKEIPKLWESYLMKMSEFLCDCCGSYGETVSFGDNDEGKVLDLCGKSFDHYRYVLDLMGLVLQKRYSRLTNLHENLYWCTHDSVLEQSKEKECYQSSLLRCYEKGGYTILRSKDDKVLIGIDHAELGFGKLAAHGHADALSLQVFCEGKPVLVDTGTYNYHVPNWERNRVRSTGAHNTVVFDGIEQAKQEDAFMWGRRYRIRFFEQEASDDIAKVIAEIQYGGRRHRREIVFDYKRTIIVTDTVLCKDISHVKLIWHTNNSDMEKCWENGIRTKDVEISSSGILIDKEYVMYSEHYNKMETGRKYIFGFREKSISTEIRIL